MNVLIKTQYLENYGAHDGERDSNGEFPQWWKFKLGREILVVNCDKEANAVALVARGVCEIEESFIELPCDWKVIGNDDVHGDATPPDYRNEFGERIDVIDFQTGKLRCPHATEDGWNVCILKI